MKFSQGVAFWREVGEGAALMFLHGSWWSGEQWLPVMERLAQKYHCLAPDLVGLGDSDRPNVNYSIALEVEFLAEYLETLRLRQVYIVAHSLGAWVAVSYALRYPDRVKGLILLAPEGIALQGHLRWWLARLLRWCPPAAFWILHKILFHLPLQPLLSRLATWQQRFRLAPTACKLLFARRAAAVKAEQVQDRLGQLAQPVLLLATTPIDSEAGQLLLGYNGLLTQAEVEYWPEIHHEPLAEDVLPDPEWLAQRIQTWLRRQG